MRLFGITGGIGSGKSTIAAGLRAEGFAVYDTDSEAQRIMRDNPCVRSQIELLFGSDIYEGDILNRTEVAKQVFADPALLRRLNSIVHPAVRFDLEEWAKRQTDICFAESAILFESGINEICEAVVFITAPEALRIERTMKRDNATQEQVLLRIHNQMADEERESMSDLVVCNDGTTDIATLCHSIISFCRSRQ